MKKEGLLTSIDRWQTDMLQRTLSLAVINLGFASLVGLQDVAEKLFPWFDKIADECELFYFVCCR